jgi:hypothetical protein
MCIVFDLVVVAVEPWGQGLSIALDPTFGSFTLLESWVSLVKVFRLFRLEWIFLDPTFGSFTLLELGFFGESV